MQMQYSTEREPRHAQIVGDYNHSDAMSYQSRYGKQYIQNRQSSDRSGVSPSNTHIYIGGLNQDISNSQNASMISQNQMHNQQRNNFNQMAGNQWGYASPQGQPTMVVGSEMSGPNHLQIQFKPQGLQAHHGSQQSLMSYQPESQMPHSVQSFNNTGHTSSILNLQIPQGIVNQPHNANRYPTIPEASQETEGPPMRSDSKAHVKRGTDYGPDVQVKSVEELQRMLDAELKKKKDAANQSLTSSRGVGAVDVPPSVSIRVICRIKPAKVPTDKETQRNLDFQKYRQFRSSSRGKQTFSFNSQHPNQSSMSALDFNGPTNLAQDSVRSFSSNRRDSVRKVTQRGLRTQQSPANSILKSRTAAKIVHTCSRGCSAESSKDESGDRANARLSTQAGQQPLHTARARPTDQISFRQDQSALQAVTSRRMPRSSSLGQQPCLMYNKMLKNEAQYNIFTTRETSKVVIASDMPVSGKLLNDTVRTPNDVPCLQNNPVSFQFDQVLDETSQGRQEKLYSQSVRPIVHNFIEGRSGCVVLLGPSDCGKTYTLKGSQGAERGIAPRAIEDILSIIKNTDVQELNHTPSFNQGFSGDFAGSGKVFLKMSIFMIAMDEIYDLLERPRKNSEELKMPRIEHYLDQNTNQVVSQLQGVTERLVLSSEDFYIGISDAYRNRKELGTHRLQDKDLRKKSHFVISLSLVQPSPDRKGKVVQLSQLNLVELSGSEQAVSPSAHGNTFQNMRQTAVHEFVSKSFNSLSCHLMRLLQRSKKSDNSLISDETETKLIGCLRSTLTLSSNILIVNCVDPGAMLFEHCLPSLKFCASIREQIQKKLKKLRAGRKEKKEKPLKQKKQKDLDIPNLVLSQIKAAERTCRKIQDSLVDFEFQMEQNPSNQHVAAQCFTQVQSLKELIRDFDTLLQFVSADGKPSSELLEELIKASVKSRSRLIFLRDRLCRMFEPRQGQRLPSHDSYQQSDGIQVYHSQWTHEDGRTSTTQSAQHSAVKGSQQQMTQRMPVQNPGQNLPLQYEMNTIDDVNSRQQNSSIQYQFEQPQQLQFQFNTVDERQFPQSFPGLPSGYGNQRGSLSRSRSQSRERPTMPEANLHNIHQQRSAHTYHPSAQQPLSMNEASQVRSFGHSKQKTHNGTVREMEGRFAQIKSEIMMPKLVVPTDLPSLEQVKARLPSDALKTPSIIDKIQSKQLYRSEDELVNDVQRLMLLQDQDGLKMRVLSLYRDKDQILATAQTHMQAFLKEHSDCKAREVLLSDHADALSQNVKEINNFAVLMHEKYSEVEHELMETCKQLEEEIKIQQQQIEELRENDELMAGEKLKAEQVRDEEHKARIEAEKQARDTMAENEKLKKNYEILKEHEMNVIRDCEVKKTTELKEKTDALFAEKEKYLSQQLKLDSQSVEIASLKEQIMNLKNDIRLKDHEKEQALEKVRAHHSEILALKHECSTAAQKHSDSLDVISGMRIKYEQLLAERDDRIKDIDDLKSELQRQDQTKEAQNSLIGQLRSEIQSLKQAVQQAHCDKQGVQDSLAEEIERSSHLKQEKDMLIQKFREDQAALRGQVDSLKGLVAKKDKELLTIKAGEFDKVDVIKSLAEAEGKQNYLASENERLKEQVRSAQETVHNLQEELDMMRQVVQTKEQEVKELAIHHETNLEQFDSKFDTLHQQLQSALQDNSKMKTQHQQYRDKTNELEKEKQYWKDKCRQAERKSEDINQKILELETELRSIIFERQSRSQQDVKSAESADNKSEAKQAERSVAQVQAKKQVFGDIHSMITQYKQNRSDSKNNREENRPKQVGRDSKLPPKSSPQVDSNRQQSEPTLASDRLQKARPPPSLHVQHFNQVSSFAQSKQDSQTRGESSREGTMIKKPGFSTFGTVTAVKDLLGGEKYQSEYARLCLQGSSVESSSAGWEDRQTAPISVHDDSQPKSSRVQRQVNPYQNRNK